MKNFKKVWGKGGSNLGNIVTKKITGEPLSEHEKTTLRDFRAEVVPVNPQLALFKNKKLEKQRSVRHWLKLKQKLLLKELKS